MTDSLSVCRMDNVYKQTHCIRCMAANCSSLSCSGISLRQRRCMLFFSFATENIVQPPFEEIARVAPSRNA